MIVSFRTKRTAISCIADPSMAWDDVESAETVARSNDVTIAVTGTGFTLNNEITTGNSNILTADGVACGSAIVTVTGCDETVIVGGVRCTTGSWNACGSMSSGWCVSTGDVITYSFGNERHYRYETACSNAGYQTCVFYQETVGAYCVDDLPPTNCTCPVAGFNACGCTISYWSC